MLWYHAGLRAAPFAAATISQLPSGPGHQPTGLVRLAPLLAPMTPAGALAEQDLPLVGVHVTAPGCSLVGVAQRVCPRRGL